MRILSSLGALLCVSSFLAVGCGDDDGSNPDAGGGKTMTKLVGPEGGTVELAGGAKVEIPKDALGSTVSITVTELEDGDVADLPMNLEGAGKGFAFKPHGTMFLMPIKVTLPYTPLTNEGPLEVRPVKLDDEDDTTWTTVFPSEKVGTDKVELNTTSFSVYQAARPRRESGIVTLPDGAIVEADSGTDASVDAAMEPDAGLDATVEVDAGVDATVMVNRCDTSNGGCDSLVTCADTGDVVVVCGACPVGYVGDGATGCVPTLIDLTPSAGSLTPALSTTETSYGVTVPALTQTFTATLTAPAGATLTVTGLAHTSGTAWQSPVLVTGDNVFTLVVARGALSTTYTLTVTRAALTETDYIKASSAETYLGFGRSVAIRGDVVAVGAPGFSQSLGAVYIYRRTSNAWMLEARLDNPSGVQAESFGNSVAIDGDTLVVGAFGESSDGATGSSASSGAAYVFEYSGGTWTPFATLKASNFGAYDYFGERVAISGDTIVVGATGESSDPSIGPADDSFYNAGAAYVFTRGSSTWQEQAMLKASNADYYDYFGAAVSVSGDTVVIGAPGESSSATTINGDETNNASYENGAAYVFTRTGTSWTRSAYLKAATGEDYDRFGAAVALSGDTVAVAATGESSGVVDDPSDNSVDKAGAVYIFTGNGATWAQQAYIKAGNPDAPGYGEGGWDNFGYSIGLDGDVLIVGAAEEDNPARGINVPYDTFNNNTEDEEVGAAYVFERTAGLWSQRQYLKASNADVQDEFGYGVAVSGTTLVCAAHNEASSALGVNDTTLGPGDNSGTSVGAAYIFR